MEIRQAGLSDVDTLSGMNKRLIEDERHPNPMSGPELASRMTGWLKGEYVCHMAFDGGEAIAYCLFRDDGEFYYMRQLYVEKGRRRQGIATQLLDWMYGNVWTDKKVRLDVLAHNEDALAFYQAYGFRIGCLRLEK